MNGDVLVVFKVLADVFEAGGEIGVHAFVGDAGRCEELGERGEFGGAVAGFFDEFAGGAVSGVFARFEAAGWELPQDAADGETVVADHDDAGFARVARGARVGGGGASGVGVEDGEDADGAGMTDHLAFDDASAAVWSGVAAAASAGLFEHDDVEVEFFAAVVGAPADGFGGGRVVGSGVGAGCVVGVVRRVHGANYTGAVGRGRSIGRPCES